MFVFSYRCTEDTVAALQLPGGCRRLLAEAQLAENLWPPVGVSASLRGPQCWIHSFLTLGGTPTGHGGARHAGREGWRDQAAPNPSAGDCEELQSRSMFLKAETALLLLSLQCNTFLPLGNSSRNQQAFWQHHTLVSSGKWNTNCDDFTAPWSSTLSLSCYLEMSHCLKLRGALCKR